MKVLILSALSMLIPFCLSAAPNTLTEEEKKNGWVLLFDGKSTDGWRNFKREDVSKKWIAKDGMLTLTGRRGGDLITTKQYENYDLKLEWKISKNGNSGIFIHSSEDDRVIYKKAIEIQIIDSPKSRDVHQPGAIYDLIPAKKETIKDAGEWNQVRILIENGRVQTWQNGVKISDFVPRGEEFKKMIANSKFKNWKGFGQNKKGYIGLQDHGNSVSFRNIKIREIK